MVNEGVCASKQLVATYEELRQAVLEAKEGLSPLFSHAAALIQEGGMAEFIACSREVFSARQSIPAIDERDSSVKPVLSRQSQSELIRILSEVAVSNIEMGFAA